MCESGRQVTLEHCRRESSDAREEGVREEDVDAGEDRKDVERARELGEDERVKRRLDAVPPSPCALVHCVEKRREGESADEELEGEAVGRAEARKVGASCAQETTVSRPSLRLVESRATYPCTAGRRRGCSRASLR